MTVFALFCHGLVIQSRKTCLERVYPSCMQGFWAAEMPPAPIGSPVPSSWLKLGGEGRNALDVPTAEPGHLAPELSLTARRTGNGGSAGPGGPVWVGPAEPGLGESPGRPHVEGWSSSQPRGCWWGDKVCCCLCVALRTSSCPDLPAVTRDTLLLPEVRRFNKSF